LFTSRQLFHLRDKPNQRLSGKKHVMNGWSNGKTTIFNGKTTIFNGIPPTIFPLV
jgi:hypothetical protein